MTTKIMTQCKTQVDPKAVRRESIDGVEHIIVRSATLPDDIVMNGILYPAEEIEKGYKSLDLTLAPVEHPSHDGQYISASDPRAIHNYHAGAFNMNATREDGRVWVDKYINVQEAKKTERGKRLLDRIDELENNSDPRPIHTSVAVFHTIEKLDEPQTNSQGLEYSAVSYEMVFDHDAILLDSIGAAQPHQGVGIAVNRDGVEYEIESFTLNDHGKSANGVEQAVYAALEKAAIGVDGVEELYSDRVIFRRSEEYYEVPYLIDGEGIVTIVGIPLVVERNVSFLPKTNNLEGDIMKDKILSALNAAKVPTEGLTDDQLFDAYNDLMTAEPEAEVDIVANALEEVTANFNKKLDELNAKIQQADNSELERLVEVVVNSDKFPGLDADSAKSLGVEALRPMAANCQPAFGVSPIINSTVTDDTFDAPSEMPA